MLLDALDAEVELDRHSSIMIIGGGVAGITLARKLSARNRVLMLESGGLSADPAVQSLYEGDIAGLDYSLTGTRLRFLGGTSNHWGGWCGHFDDADFSVREWVPYSGWPITHNELTPYYYEAAEILNLGRAEFSPGNLPRDNQLETFSGNPWLRHRVFRFSKPVTRMSEKYHGELSRNERIEVLLNTNAVDFKLDENGDRVSQVQVRTLGGRSGTITADKVIVCCGAIENARLLLASRSQQANGIGNQNDLVGRFFMEHPHIQLLELLPRDPAWCNAQMALRKDGDHWFGLGLTMNERVLREERCLNMSAHFFNRQCTSGQTVQVSAMFEQAPNPDSRVTLSNQVDALGMPRVRLDWRLTDLDYRSFHNGAHTIARTVGSMGLGRVRLSAWANESEPWAVGYGSHHMGTTRMADSPRAGVVDANCRVHGMDNLYIAGSSVYTTAGPINPTFTLTSLALRLADHLLG